MKVDIYEKNNNKINVRKKLRSTKKINSEKSLTDRKGAL